MNLTAGKLYKLKGFRRKTNIFLYKSPNLKSKWDLILYDENNIIMYLRTVRANSLTQERAYYICYKGICYYVQAKDVRMLNIENKVV